MAVDTELQQELESLKLQQHYLLETLKTGVLVTDAQDYVTSHNEASVICWGLPSSRLVGEKLQNTKLVFRCPELPAHMEATRSSGNQVVTFQCRVTIDGEEHVMFVMLRPIVTGSESRQGTVIYSEDITAQDKLQSTVEQLKATDEELQAANEELETTNTELQFTNDELVTTNDDLQSLHEELENMNEELKHRSRALKDLTDRYAETLRLMPWPLLLVDRNERVQIWNNAAQTLFGVGATSVVGVRVEQLPVGIELRKSILRRCRTVLAKNRPTILKNEIFTTKKFEGRFDLHFTPISRDPSSLEGVLIMFGPHSSRIQASRTKRPTARSSSKQRRHLNPGS